jgi:drug/metabolite transporter (DMT)-like permease
MPTQTPSHHNLGLRYTAESALYFSLMSVLVKWAGATVPFEQIVLARTLCGLVFTWGALTRLGISPWGHRRDLLFLRGLFGFTALSCFYFALTRLPLADATIIQYTNPLMVAALAAAILGERLGRRDMAAMALGLAGVVVVTQPSFIFGGPARLPSFEVTVASAGAFASACAYVTVRKLGQTENPLVVVFWFPLVSLPVALPWGLSADHIPNVRELAILLGVGICVQAAQVRLTQGLQLEKAGRAMAMTYLQVLFAAGWGMLFFNEALDREALLGGASVLAGSVLLLKRAESRNNDEPGCAQFPSEDA